MKSFHPLHPPLFSVLAFVLGLGIAVFFSSTFTPTVGAEDEPRLSLKTCQNQYYDFIANVRSENTRNETIKDAVTMGYCQVTDIFTLNDELDALREAFLSAAVNCEDLSSYQADYHRILLEQYFVRHVQETPSDALNAVDVQVLEAQLELKLETLKKKMVDLFVIQEERVSETVLNGYFDAWVLKYQDRLAKYRACDEGPWAELTQILFDSLEDWQNLGISKPNIEQGTSIKDLLIPSVDVDADADMTAFGSALKNAWSFLKSERSKLENELEAPLDVSELSDRGIVSYEEALLQLDQSSNRYTLELDSVERMSRYKVLYGMGGSVASTNMVGLLEQLNSILVEVTTKDLPNLTLSTAKVYDKQCN
jgi:hypothetical protein